MASSGHEKNMACHPSAGKNSAIWLKDGCIRWNYKVKKLPGVMNNQVLPFRVERIFEIMRMVTGFRLSCGGHS
jgi:hypothetical protein